ncbi:MAG: MOSC domain-containing protein [Verrucomicrobiota bacterium]
MEDWFHKVAEDLEAGIAEVSNSPAAEGVLDAIVTRPAENRRKVAETGELSPERGLHDDCWERGCWLKLPNGDPHPDVQLAIMNSRFAKLIAGDDPANWAEAGDQLYVDLDLSRENLQPGDRLRIGDEAEIVITDQEHTGCAKFAKRFGKVALGFTAAPEGHQMRLRGIYARVEAAGEINVGDKIVKL